MFIPFTLFFTLGFLIAGAIVAAFGRAMPARTPDGVAEHDHLKGLELYMKMAEADRIKMLQSPDGAEKTSIDPTDKKQLVKLYESLLPYAVLFGLEKQWAQEFAKLYEQPPDWYGGSAAFNAAAFSHAVGGFNSAAAAMTSMKMVPEPSNCTRGPFEAAPFLNWYIPLRMPEAASSGIAGCS